MIGLTHGFSNAQIESLTVEAIPTHLQLVDQPFQVLLEDYKSGKASGGDQYLTFGSTVHDPVDDKVDRDGERRDCGCRD